MSAENKLDKVQVGDSVERLIGGVGGAVMTLKVTGVTKDRIYCGPWEFSRKNGAEIDEDMGWDEQATGSFIKP
jgi:hypothetical protein